MKRFCFPAKEKQIYLWSGCERRSKGRRTSGAPRAPPAPPPPPPAAAPDGVKVIKVNW